MDLLGTYNIKKIYCRSSFKLFIYSKSIYCSNILVDSCVKVCLEKLSHIHWRCQTEEEVEFNLSEEISQEEGQENFKLPGAAQYKLELFCCPDERSVVSASRLFSLPSGYSQHHSQEYYKLRSFSIRKGRVINLGESMESRKSKSMETSGCVSPRWTSVTCQSPLSVLQVSGLHLHLQLAPAESPARAGAGGREEGESLPGGAGTGGQDVSGLSLCHVWTHTHLWCFTGWVS